MSAESKSHIDARNNVIGSL